MSTVIALQRDLLREEARSAPMPAAAPAYMGASVDIRGLGKRFGRRRVLDRLELRIEPGQFVAIVGRSGCGKSTLLRLLAGLEAPSAGEARLDGTPIAGLAGDVRMLFQDARLLPWQRVGDNVGIARGPDWRRRAQAALVDVGLAERAHDWPAVLSGGQRQRVALARALVSQPRLLLLDEPFGALDALTRIEMHALLGRVWRAHRFTTVLITHDVGEAVHLADRVLVLKDGRFTLDLAVPAPRPRETDDAALLALQKRVLHAV